MHDWLLMVPIFLAQGVAVGLVVFSQRHGRPSEPPPVLPPSGRRRAVLPPSRRAKGVRTNRGARKA
jgi:hypothetical protein